MSFSFPLFIFQFYSVEPHLHSLRHLGRNFPPFTNIEKYCYFITSENSYLRSNRNATVTQLFVWFEKSSLVIPMCFLISLFHYPSTVITTPIYLNSYLCFILTSPLCRSHQGLYSLMIAHSIFRYEKTKLIYYINNALKMFRYGFMVCLLIEIKRS